MKRIVVTQDLSIKKIFSNFDKDKTGSLDEQELTQMLKIIDKSITQSSVNIIMKHFDKDGNGTVDYLEFDQFFK